MRTRSVSLVPSVPVRPAAVPRCRDAKKSASATGATPASSRCPRTRRSGSSPFPLAKSTALPRTARSSAVGCGMPCVASLRLRGRPGSRRCCSEVSDATSRLQRLGDLLEIGGACRLGVGGSIQDVEQARRLQRLGAVCPGAHAGLAAAFRMAASTGVHSFSCSAESPITGLSAMTRASSTAAASAAPYELDGGRIGRRGGVLGEGQAAPGQDGAERDRGQEGRSHDAALSCADKIGKAK